MKNAHIRNIAHNIILFSICVAVASTVLVSFMPNSAVRALPEYANRTDESCGACHVSPGGAGPLTLTGLSWIADGRPDAVVGFDNVLIAPGVNDAQMLYEIACAACHGFYGEGLSGSKLIGFNFRKVFLRRVITDGVLDFGMPGFAGEFTPEQLEGLSEYVSDLSAGRIEPLESYPLPQGIITCSSYDSQTSCGGN